MIFETDEVQVFEAKSGTPKQPPDRHDGIETQEMAVAVSVSCSICPRKCYILGEPPSMYTEKDVKYICQRCLEDINNER